MSPRIRPWLTAAVMLLVVIRFAVAFQSGQRFMRGDFYATLPGPYAETVNPTLWASPDLEDVQGKSASYLRGPTQYVTMYPLVYFDSYESIAWFLLVVYGLLILLIAEVMWRLLGEVAGAAIARAPIFAATICYFPLLQAWLGREFEVMIALAFALAMWAAIRSRWLPLGGILAFVTLYKYIPVMVLPYLIVRRWWQAIIGLVIGAVVLIGTAHWLVGLEGFVKNSIPGIATGTLTSLGSTKAFCDGPVPLLRFNESGQEASVRTALCSLSVSVPIAPAAIYLAIIVITLGAAVYGTVRLERHRHTLPDGTERWRRVMELSLLALVSSTFFYAHYYYLSILVVPLNVLLVHELQSPRRRSVSMVVWGLSYLLLAAFLLPPTFLSRLVGIDLWPLYFSSLAYFSGEMLLLGLLLFRYVTLPLGLLPRAT